MRHHSRALPGRFSIEAARREGTCRWRRAARRFRAHRAPGCTPGPLRRTGTGIKAPPRVLGPFPHSTPTGVAGRRRTGPGFSRGARPRPRRATAMGRSRRRKVRQFSCARHSACPTRNPAAPSSSLCRHRHQGGPLLFLMRHALSGRQICPDSSKVK